MKMKSSILFTQRSASLFAGLIASVALHLSCTTSPPSQPIEAMHEDIAALASNIHLSPLPSTAQWEIVSLNEFSGEAALIAVLDYEADSASRLRAQLVPTDYPLRNLPRHVLRDWIPAAIQSHLIANDDSVRSFRVMENGYEVMPFAKGALLHGSCFWVGDQLVLHIYSL